MIASSGSELPPYLSALSASLHPLLVTPFAVRTCRKQCVGSSIFRAMSRFFAGLVAGTP